MTMTAIDKTRPEGAHIPLTCINHPDMRWFTKNIDYIGARSIFFDSFTDKECDCSISDLRVVPTNKETTK